MLQCCGPLARLQHTHMVPALLSRLVPAWASRASRIKAVFFASPVVPYQFPQACKSRPCSHISCHRLSVSSRSPNPLSIYIGFNEVLPSRSATAASSPVRRYLTYEHPDVVQLSQRPKLQLLSHICKGEARGFLPG